MRTTIDSAGRVVIPKQIRSDLMLNGGEEVEVVRVQDRIEISVAPREVKIEAGSHGLLSSDLDVPPHGPDQVREELERARR